jgi:phage nucleotide-binding protein
MKMYSTTDSQVKPSVVMMVYGQGGVGKTTFASTAPHPILMDCENGAKYFGLRGIKLDVALIESWKDVEEFFVSIKNSEYETVIIDPIGELMEKLKAHMIASKDAKLVMRDGTPTMAGWGWMKDKMRAFVKAVRDLNKHMIIIAHVTEKGDEDRIVKRPLVMTKLSEELVNMVDIVGFFTTVTDGDEEKRIIRIQPSDKYEAKDRTGQLGGVIEPNFAKIVAACQGTETFAWSSEKAKKAEAAKAADAAKGETPQDAPVEPPKGKKGKDTEPTPETQPAQPEEPQGEEKKQEEAAGDTSEKDSKLNQALEA